MSALHRLFVLGALALVSCSGAEPQDVLASPRGAAASSSSGGASSSTGGASSSNGGSTACAPEVEPNDSQETANDLAPERCGTLSPEDKRDYLRFTLKPTTQTLSLNFSGAIRLKVDAPNGDKVELTPENAKPVPFVRGGPYFIAVTALNNNANVNWRVEVVEN
jgi:hypothetical protein